MRAITVRQPWAWAIIYGGKNVENRTRIDQWRHAVGQRIAIHAGRTWDDNGLQQVAEIAGFGHVADWAEVSLGALIGTVDVTDVHWSDSECCDPWGEHNPFRGAVHLTLTNPRPLPEPIPCTGQVGLWRVTGTAARQLEAVLTP